MKQCPRCQSRLERLRMGDVETLTCNRCGFADVPVDHESEREESESWQEAMNRFYNR